MREQIHSPTATASTTRHDNSQDIHAILLDRIEHHTLSLPLLPQVAQQVLTLTADPNADATQFSRLIQQDQALAGQILKIANSPAYLPRSAIVSLQQAITWLGLKVLSELAFSISMQNGVFRLPGYQQEVARLWQHALGSGLFAKEIARQSRQNVENAFLCGLLHTIGKPVVLQEIIRIQNDLGQSTSWETMATFMETYHIIVGGKVAEDWQLPNTVRQAIAHYQDYAQDPSPTKGALITCLADYLAAALLDETPLTPEILSSHHAIQDLNFYPEDVELILEQRDTILSTIHAMTL